MQKSQNPDTHEAVYCSTDKTYVLPAFNTDNSLQLTGYLRNINDGILEQLSTVTVEGAFQVDSEAGV